MKYPKIEEVRCTRCGIILAGVALKKSIQAKQQEEIRHGYKSATVCTECLWNYKNLPLT
jgi:uncharacterized protein with PIN domain